MVSTERRWVGGSEMTVGGVIKSTKKSWAICYADCIWESFRVSDEQPWEVVSDRETNVPTSAIFGKVGSDGSGTAIKPEGFLSDRQQGDNNWTWFHEYSSGPVEREAAALLPSRLQSMKAGQRVSCSGKVLGDATDAVLVALAQAPESQATPKAGQQVKESQLRRIAVVASAGQLVIAQLLGTDCAYV